jgi:hypothetical protein
MKKKILIVISFACLSSLAYTQIPNGGFETWENESPSGYTTSKVLLDQLFTPSNVTQTNEAYAGSSAIKLETIEFDNFFTGEVDTLAGTAYSGDLAKKITGFPFSSKPISFSGFYKTTFTKTDTATIKIGLYTWNTATLKRDSVGGAIFFTSTSVNTYTHFTGNFVYTSSSKMPDTAVVFLASSGKRPIPGSVLFVDELMIDNVTAASGPSLKNFTLAYPNPASELFHINNIPANGKKVEVRDMTGRLVEQIATQENVVVNVSAYSEGLYYYSVKTESGDLLYNDKFSVIK